MYSRNVPLPDVVQALNKAGFDKEDICMVLSPAHPDAAIFSAAADFSVTPEKNASTARIIAWFSGFGGVVIPTVGLFVRSQAFLQALLAEQTSSQLSRGSRALLSLGFSQADAQRLGHRLSDVGALVYVSCREITKAMGAIELLRSTGAQEAASLNAAKKFSAAA